MSVFLDVDLSLRPKSVCDSFAGTRLRREHLSALGGAMGTAHQAAGLPSFDHYESDVHHLHRVDVRRGLVGGPDRARRPLG